MSSFSQLFSETVAVIFLEVSPFSGILFKMYDCMPVCNVYECMWNVCMNVQTQFLASKYVFVGRVRALVDWFPGIAVELMKTAGASPSRFWANLVHR